jgi:hypothetical protein
MSTKTLFTASAGFEAAVTLSHPACWTSFAQAARAQLPGERALRFAGRLGALSWWRTLIGCEPN